MKRFENAKLVFGILVLVFACLVSQLAFCVGKNLVGQEAPEMRIAKWIDGNDRITLDEANGRVVILEFWATCCPPCMKSIPHLGYLHDEYAKKGLIVIAISRENEGVIKKLMKKMEMPFRLATDANGATNRAYGIQSIPTAYLIDVDGIVIWQGHTLEIDEKQVQEALKAVKNRKKEVIMY